jgi:hypothetical protein
MKFFCSVLTLLLAMSAFAATPKNVSYKSGDETVQALIYTPEGKGPFPGILVIHEWWGLRRLGQGTGVEALRSGVCHAGG